jgi:hypothetical protein
MATPWLTGAGAVGHMRTRWTVEAHVAAQEREIVVLRTVTRTLRFNSCTYFWTLDIFALLRPPLRIQLSR